VSIKNRFQYETKQVNMKHERTKTSYNSNAFRFTFARHEKLIVKNINMKSSDLRICRIRYIVS